MYTKKYKIRMHDTDAAGVTFFASQFRIAHEAYEEFADKLGFGFGKLLEKNKYFIPIVHAEADYKCPLSIGTTIKINLAVEHVGKHSYTIAYSLEKSDLLHKTIVGTAKTVHVVIDARTEKKTAIPKNIRYALEKNLA